MFASQLTVSAHQSLSGLLRPPGRCPATMEHLCLSLGSQWCSTQERLHGAQQGRGPEDLRLRGLRDTTASELDGACQPRPQAIF